MSGPLDVLLSRTMQEILALLLLHPQREYYQREIAEATGMNLRGVQQALQRLVEGGILTRTQRGRQVFYRPDRDCPILEDLTRIFVKTIGVADRIREALAPLEEKIDVAVIFGSWARGDQQPDSDIDLLMIGDVPLQEVSKALQDVGREPGREINPVVMSPEEFRQRLSDGDHFATRLVNGRTLQVIGDPDELEGMAR